MPVPVDLAVLADAVRAAAGDDVRLIDLAATLERAGESDRPVRVLASLLGLTANQRSPAKVARDEALAALAALPMFAGLEGRQLDAAVVTQLARYAGSTWIIDRDRDRMPYPDPDGFHALAWRALKAVAAIPGERTVRRARDKFRLSGPLSHPATDEEVEA